MTLKELYDQLNVCFEREMERCIIALNEITMEVAAPHLITVCKTLRDASYFEFNCLIDVCGVDYLQYGKSQWETQDATETGFSRGVESMRQEDIIIKEEGRAKRFASVYHLLSITHNHRLRIRVKLSEHDLKVPSVIDIWPAANWFEREAFDLFGIIYEGHPDMRRLLTDYGFMGHPFRKDFPLIGNVEVRYDAQLRRVVYGPVSIAPRVLGPKVIRDDKRYNGDT